jgi:hypothetical protein
MHDHIAREPTWPALLAVLGVIALQLTLAERLSLGPNWIVPGLEFVLLVALQVSAPQRKPGEAKGLRVLTVCLVGLITLANASSLVLLIEFLLDGTKKSGESLFFNALSLWSTNVLAFALWYWELDRGGPARRRVNARHPDFLFTQMADAKFAAHGWYPHFLDYLFVSFTNATSFSPADTVPLTRWAKVLMMVQALVSLLTIALVASRAVNIL